jgi:fatty acid desaturase
MKVTDWLSKDEIRSLTARSDKKAAVIVAFNWMLIALTFAVVAAWTNPLTILLAVIVLGGRQLGLAILMHEAGHQTLFRSRALNGSVGQWLFAHPILADADAYAASHREHHRRAGSEQDPDLPNYQAYPVSKASFGRKLKRDLTGQTGVRNLIGTLSGRSADLMMRAGEKPASRGRGLLANAILLAVLAATGHAWLYLLWVAAYVTTYPLFARIRQVAEHGNVTDLYDPDPRLHTRTTLANPLERLLLCPNHVNYHLEHHFVAGVPTYNLPRFHRLLVERGFYRGHEASIAHGYRDIVRRAVPALDRRASAAA